MLASRISTKLRENDAAASSLFILGNDPIAFDTAKGRHGMGHTVAGRMSHRRHVAEIEEATTTFGQM